MASAGRRSPRTARIARWCARGRRAVSAATARRKPACPCRSGFSRELYGGVCGDQKLAAEAAPTGADAGDVTGAVARSSNRQGTPPDPRKPPMKNDNTIRYLQLLPDVFKALGKTNPAQIGSVSGRERVCKYV